MKVNDLCHTWNNTNGHCLSCYGGYELMEGRCLIIKLDAGCKDWNWTDLTCIACSYRYYKNNNNKCMAVSDYC